MYTVMFHHKDTRGAQFKEALGVREYCTAERPSNKVSTMVQGLEWLCWISKAWRSKAMLVAAQLSATASAVGGTVALFSVRS
jgi:hypothetical protein